LRSGAAPDDKAGHNAQPQQNYHKDNKIENLTSILLKRQGQVILKGKGRGLSPGFNFKGVGPPNGIDILKFQAASG
jgi:hypothetical protein